MNDPFIREFSQAIEETLAGNMTKAAQILSHLPEVQNRSTAGQFGELATGNAIDTSLTSDSLSGPRKKDIVATFARDNYTCRLCGRHTIHLEVMKAVSRIFPKEFPYVPSWEYGLGHLSYWEISTSVDHFVPKKVRVSHHISNLLTACYGCNRRKRAFTDWRKLPLSDEPWDGLLSYLPGLTRIARSAD